MTLLQEKEVFERLDLLERRFQELVIALSCGDGISMALSTQINGVLQNFESELSGIKITLLGQL